MKKKKLTKGKIVLIIIGILIFSIYIMGVIDSNKKIQELGLASERVQEKLYKEAGGKENYDRNQLFKRKSEEIANKLPENMELLDIKLKENSNDIDLILVKEKNPNRIYNWLESGIPEGQTYALDSDTRQRLTALYGEEYIYTEKIEYCIYNTELQSRSTSFDEIIMSNNWEGLKYSWKNFGN